MWYPVADASYIVRGSAKFDEREAGCRMTYELELADEEGNDALDRARELLEAFREWVANAP